MPDDYLQVSRKPWPSLVFLFPLVVAYEFGTVFFARDPASGTETRIIAFTLLSNFLNLFGATGRYLPALAVIGILLGLHLSHRDRWRFPPRILGLMAAESACWTLPLLAVAMIVAHYVPLAAPFSGVVAGWESGGTTVALTPPEMGVGEMIVLSIGAGVYEELVFRLVAFAVLSLILTDLLGMPPKRAGLLIVFISAVVFSLYHYLGSEEPMWRTFVFRTVAGVFFGSLYLWRGFGITAGTHAAYDIVVQVLL